MDDMKTGVSDRFDEIENDMESGFSDLGKRVDEMSCDELRREIQILMMIGHQQMSQMRLMRVELDDGHRELLRRTAVLDRTFADMKEIADELNVPFDPECDSPHVAARHILCCLRSNAEDEGDTPGYMEIGAFVACVVLSACFVVWTLLMVSAWVR